MRILVQVAAFMLVLILIAAIRGRGDFDTATPLTWVFAAGFLAMMIGSNPVFPNGTGSPGDA